MTDEPPRSRSARKAAEEALVRVVHHYGATPEFVLLGGSCPRFCVQVWRLSTPELLTSTFRSTSKSLPAQQCEEAGTGALATRS